MHVIGLGLRKRQKIQFHKERQRNKPEGQTDEKIEKNSKCKNTHIISGWKDREKQQMQIAQILIETHLPDTSKKKE